MNSFDLNTAVFIQDQQIKTDSLKVAEFFGKRHDNILRAIEKILAMDFNALNFEGVKSNEPKIRLAEFNQLNFQLVKYKDIKGEERPMYEMTKDGWMLLVMGFTGEKAAQIKIAYINAFNQMADLLQKQLLQIPQLTAGSLVQLKSGSQQLTVSQIENDIAQVHWFKNGKLYEHSFPVYCLVLDRALPQIEQAQQRLNEFWNALFEADIQKFNHSSQSNILALNLTQIYNTIPNLPLRQNMLTDLASSNAPFPQYLNRNLAYRSAIDHQVYKCWIFKNPKMAVANTDVEAES